MYLIGVDKIFKFFIFYELLGFFAEAEQSLNAFDYVFLFEIHQKNIMFKHFSNYLK
jgi:hypothetical protein